MSEQTAGTARAADTPSVAANGVPPWLRPLLQPIQIGSVAVPNRLFLPAHTTNFAINQRPSERHTAYLTERVRGGVGLVISEATRVARSSARGNLRLGIFSDADIEPFSMLPAAIHDAGGLIFSQLVHSGRRAGGHRTLVAGAGPSALPWSASAHVPHVLYESEIDELVVAFGGGARRAVAAGFDGIELHLGHGHLLQQFLSPFTNHRSDRYGGSLENRLRFPMRVLEAVLEGAGAAPVGVRVSADEFLPGGLKVEQVVEIVATLGERYPIAFIDVSHSAYQAGYSVSTQIADMTHPPAPFREFPAAFAATFPDVPVLGVCRIDDLELAAELVGSGTMSMAGLVRAHIADSQLLRKHLAGRGERVNSCVACNEGCIGRLELGQPISCVVNTRAGYERAWLHIDKRSADTGRIVVMGAGPAGLAAAAECAERGHSVTVLERADRVGGAVLHGSSLHRRGRLVRLVDQLERRARTAGVQIRLGTDVPPISLLELAPDAVIVATGADRPILADFGVPVWSVFDVLDRNVPAPGQRTVVYDEHGGWPGLGAAWTLAIRGVAVEYVAPVGEVGWRIASYSRFGLLHELAACGVTVHPMRRVVAGPAGSVTIVDAGGTTQNALAVDGVVHVPVPQSDGTHRQALLDAGAARVLVIGDAFAPRGLFEATLEGHAAAVAIDSGSSAQEVVYDLLDA